MSESNETSRESLAVQGPDGPSHEAAPPRGTQSPGHRGDGLARTFWRALANYRMAGVLLILCAYYSFATLQEQRPEGEAAAKILARELAGAANKGPGGVLIVARKGEADVRFAETLEARLNGASLNVCAKVLGDPRDARLAMEQLEKAGTNVAVIATTADCAGWKVFENIQSRYGAFAAAQIRYADSYRWPTFLKPDNLLNVANQIVVVAVIAVGMTLVIITGGIDLSVGSLVAFSAVVVAMLIRDWGGGVNATPAAMVLCSTAAVVGCMLIGAFSGVMITAFRLPPFIATLGVMQVASGLAYILAKGGSIYDIPDSFAWLGRGAGWLSIPHAVVLMAGVYVVAHVLMSRTTLGRYIYAIGGNAEAARLSGVPVRRILILVYALCAAMAGLGGVILASQLKSGAPTYGMMYELYVIAAVVVGGTSLSGGEGRIFGTLVGALIIAVIQNGMNLTGVESYTQKVVLGLVILGAVLLDMLRRRR